VLVLAQVPGHFPDFLVLFISSQLSQASPGDVVLTTNDPEFASTGLKRSSVFRIGKIATISTQLIVGALGQLNEETVDEIVGRVVQVIRSEGSTLT